MVRLILEFLRTLTDPDKLIHLLSTILTGWLGYAALVGIIFAETGLLVGFVLPGDSLLFTVGVVSGAGRLNILLINVLLMAATIAGDTCGYLLGRKAGTRVFNRPNSRFFHREHLERTQAFYEKHGGKTIIFARFVPIIRTFAPFVAGIARMPYLRFMSFDVFGAIGWVASMTLAGYFLGGIPLVRRHFEKVVVLIIVVSLLPVFSHAFQSWRESKRKAAGN